MTSSQVIDFSVFMILCIEHILKFLLFLDILETKD